MIVAGAALAAYLGTCAPHVSPDTMRAIVGVESAGNPYALNDNTTRHSYSPRDARTALAIATVLLRRGDSVDVGIAQVSSRNFNTFHVNAAQMLDPCTNLGVASRILVADYARSSTTFVDQRQALWHAISAYNTGSLFAGKPYVDAVVAEAMRAPMVPTISLLTNSMPHLAPLSFALPALADARLPAARVRSRKVPRARIAPPAPGFGDKVKSAGIDRSLSSTIVHGAF